MWKRSSLKGQAKTAMKANYWMCVLAALILAAVVGGPAAGSAKKGADMYNQIQQMNEGQNPILNPGYDEEDMASNPLMGLIGSNSSEQINTNFSIQINSGTGLLGTVILYLVINPLTVGILGFFFVNTYKKAELEEVKRGFKPSWGRNVLAMFLRALFTALWMLLFVIPGLIKGYSYRMVPYILADDPDIDAIDAITKSRKMMDGQKWKAFVLDLSFLGWHILGVLTLGILELFYVQPYQQQTNAELYRTLRAQYQDN